MIIVFIFESLCMVVVFVIVFVRGYGLLFGMFVNVVVFLLCVFVWLYFCCYYVYVWF